MSCEDFDPDDYRETLISLTAQVNVLALAFQAAYWRAIWLRRALEDQE